MFLKQSVVLLVVGVLLVEAGSSDYNFPKFRRHSGNDHHEKHSHENTEVKIKVHESKEEEGKEGGHEGCHCGQYKEIMKKVMILLKAYGSKELIPELQTLGSKTIDYFLHYLAKEKPEQLNKVHEFLQGTTKVTGNFVGTVSAQA